MTMIGRADGHGVDRLAELVEHLAEVIELLGLLEALLRSGFRQRVIVDVADRNEVAVLEGLDEIAGGQGRGIGDEAGAGSGDYRLHLRTVEDFDVMAAPHELADHPQHGDEVAIGGDAED